jgi:hypothetical protein
MDDATKVIREIENMVADLCAMTAEPKECVGKQDIKVPT